MIILIYMIIMTIMPMGHPYYYEICMFVYIIIYFLYFNLYFVLSQRAVAGSCEEGGEGAYHVPEPQEGRG